MFTGIFALAGITVVGFTTTTDASATGACTSTVTGAHSGTVTVSGPGATRLQTCHAGRRHHGDERPRAVRDGFQDLRGRDLDVRRTFYLLPQLPRSRRNQCRHHRSTETFIENYALAASNGEDSDTNLNATPAGVSSSAP